MESPESKATYSYTYPAVGAKVEETVTDSSNVTLTRSTYEFDGLGRPTRVTKRLPGQKTA